MLVQQDVAALRGNGHVHVSTRTAEYFNGEIDSNGLRELVTQIGGAPGLLGSGRVCVIYGYGSCSKSLYRYLQTLDGIDLIWHADFGPWWMKPLLFVVASHGGLMQVTGRDDLAAAYGPLSHLAMVELYSFRESLLPSVTDYVRHAGWRSFIGELIRAEDDSYFCLGVDGDSMNTELDYSGWASFGEDCPNDLKAIIRNSPD